MRHRLTLLTVLVVGLVGCADRNAYKPPPPPEVVVVTPKIGPVTVWSDFTGVTQASELVSIRARVTGYLTQVNFVDGEMVEPDQLLFVIDPRPYQAQLDQAKADLQNKKAVALRAEAIYRRSILLVRSNAATQEDVDKNKGDWDVARADISLAEARIREAQLNLDFTEVRSPIRGRIGRRLVDAGNLVTADVTVLTTITRYQPMYAYFTVSSADYEAYLRRRKERPVGSLEEFLPPENLTAASSIGLLLGQPEGRVLAAAALVASRPRYHVEIGLSKDAGYPHKGYIDFSDNTVNANTQTLQLRGIFPNEQLALAPGLFVRVRVPISQQEHALLIPEEALVADQEGQYVLVVNKEDVVERRPIRKVGTAEGGLRAIDQGDVKPGDRVIIQGMQRARPGAKVKPVSPTTASS
jgi:RND family efflux transporter MFP subunit